MKYFFYKTETFLGSLNQMIDEFNHLEPLMKSFFRSDLSLDLSNPKSIYYNANALVTSRTQWNFTLGRPMTVFDFVETLKSTKKNQDDRFDLLNKEFLKVKDKAIFYLRQLLDFPSEIQSKSVIKMNPFSQNFYLATFQSLGLSSVSEFKDLSDYTFEGTGLLKVNNSEDGVDEKPLSEAFKYCEVYRDLTSFPISTWTRSLLIVDNSTSAFNLQLQGPLNFSEDLILHKTSTDYGVEIEAVDFLFQPSGDNHFSWTLEHKTLTISPTGTDSAILHSLIPREVIDP